MLAACRREFGFVLEERAICCDDVRVRATGAGAELPRSGDLAGETGPLPAPTCVTSAYFEACCRHTTQFIQIVAMSGHVRALGGMQGDSSLAVMFASSCQVQ